MAEHNHKERAHALLSPSGAHRWMRCTPSARLEDELPEQGETFFTLEGTLAHELAELELLLYAGRLTKKKYKEVYDELTDSEYYSEEMDEYVDTYVTFVIEEYEAALRVDEGAVLKIEDRIDLTRYVEDGFGSNDSVIVGNGRLSVVDLKYGKGVPVSAEDNEQLMLYGLGALYENMLLYDVQTVRMVIVQPRLDSISEWEISAAELLDWAENTVKPKAEMAYAGEGEMNPGDHCRWCRLKAQCPALRDYNLEVAKHRFAEPKLLSDAEILEVFERIDRLTDWAKAVADYVLQEAMNGKQWPGYKLVEGRSRRKWSDEEAAIKTLREKGFTDEEILKMSLEGITKIEKLVGKKAFPDVLGPYVVKPKGKPTLAPEGDKRPALGAESAKEVFS